MADSKKEKQIQVHCSDEMANGVYANLGVTNFNREEFILDFVFLHPSGNSGDIRSRVVLHPNHIKRLVNVLSKNLDEYEKEFGNIDGKSSIKGSDSDEIPPFTISFN